MLINFLKLRHLKRAFTSKIDNIRADKNAQGFFSPLLRQGEGACNQVGEV